MRSRALALLFALMLPLGIGHAACAQEDLATLQQRLDQFDVMRAPLVGQTVGADTAFVPRAIIDRSWSLTLGASSSIDNDKFPVTLQLSPFLWSSERVEDANSAHGFYGNLMESTIGVQYDPLLVQRVSGQKNLSSSAERDGTVTYSLPLIGRVPLQAVTDEIRARIQRILPPFGTSALTPAQLAALVSAAKDARDMVTAEYSHFTMSANAGYNWDTRPTMPASASAGLVATKVLTPLASILGKTGSVWSLNGTLSGTSYESVASAHSFSKGTGSVGIDLQLPSTILFSLVSNLDYYTDSGYSTVVGIADPTRHNDVTLKEAVTFKIPGLASAGNKLAISVSEEHLGTAQHDIAINLAASCKLPFPPDISPKAP